MLPAWVFSHIARFQELNAQLIYKLQYLCVWLIILYCMEIFPFLKENLRDKDILWLSVFPWLWVNFIWEAKLNFWETLLLQNVFHDDFVSKPIFQVCTDIPFILFFVSWLYQQPAKIPICIIPLYIHIISLFLKSGYAVFLFWFPPIAHYSILVYFWLTRSKLEYNLINFYELLKN